MERNRHILLAEKYSWDMVACCTADPLASDSDDQKKIQKAVKESKQLREEKKRAASCKVPRAKGVIPRSSERRVILECINASYMMPLVAGKQSQPRDGRSVCFCCFKPGHFARDCRAANVQNGAGAFGQETINKQASEFLMSGMANDPCCDGSVSDSFYDIIGQDSFVDVNHSCVVVKGRL